MGESLAPLTSVVAVCRSHPRVAAVDEIICRVDAFADPASSLSVPQACEKISSGLVRFLKRVAAHEPNDINPFHKHQNFTRAMVLVVQRGDLQAVQWLVETYLPTGIIREPVREAAECGRLEILQWLWANHAARLVWSGSECDLAAKNNHFETLQWLDAFVDQLQRNRVTEIDRYDLSQILSYAGEHGNIEMVRWVDEQRRRKNISLSGGYVEPGMVQAARSGHRDVLEYLCECFLVPYPDKCLTEAIRGQHLELAQWLHADIGIEVYHTHDLLNAAKCGNLDLLRWVKRRELKPINLDRLLLVINSAAAAGYLDVVRHLHDNFDEAELWVDAMNLAAEYGRLDVVIWLHKHRTEGCTSYAMNSAARNGHLETVQWLHANRAEGCTTEAMIGAAQCNHLDVVKWLHVNRSEGCTPRAMDTTALNGHLEVVQWLHENRSEGSSMLAMNYAAWSGHLDMIKWLHDNRSEGCTTSAMDNAATNGHLDVVKWLHANREEGCSSRAFHKAARNGHIDVMKWLLANKPGEFDIDTMSYAAAEGDFEVLKVVHAFAERNVPGYVPQIEWFRTALDGRNFEVVEWLGHEYGDDTPGYHDWLRQICHGRLLPDPYAQELTERMLGSRETSQ